MSLDVMRLPVPLVTIVSYAAAIAYLILLPYLAQNFYVDENALIIHSVESDVTSSELLADNDRPADVGSLLPWMQSHLAPHYISVETDGQELPLLQAIVRSRRAAGEDSIVLVAPYSAGGFSGIAATLAIFRHLSRVKWLAKVVDHCATPFSD
jgi:hypothetical protein